MSRMQAESCAEVQASRRSHYFYQGAVDKDAFD